MPNVVLGVGGGIAAYKVVSLLRLFTESGHHVDVIPTASALKFVGEPTWAALSGSPVHTDVWSDVHEVPHVRLGQQADLVVVAPATADLLARAAHGLADDLLLNTLLTARCPVVYAPAMHTEMWLHPATQANVATLRARGAIVIDPDSGRLTGADTGPGRLPEPQAIHDVALRLLAGGKRGGKHSAADLAGRTVLVTAGGTREHLDPVRFLGNRSSGRQGYALASTAVARGAKVILVSANVALPAPAGASLVPVVSAADLRAAVLEHLDSVDALVMAAAVADFRPVSRSAAKIKKSDDGADPEPVHLERTEDVLAESVARRTDPGVGPVIVGFAAETGDGQHSVLDYGRAKLVRKGCDLLVVNEVGADRGFERPDNAAVILAATGGETTVPEGPKEALADVIWDLVATRLPVGPSRLGPAPPVG